jgi:hypothetical protein
MMNDERTANGKRLERTANGEQRLTTDGHD